MIKLRVSKNSDLQKEVVKFYKDLMGTSASTLPAIDVEIMRRGPMLDVSQQRTLCAPVTEQEIFNALSSIGDNKAPGVDGFNAYFFKRMWGIIKLDIIQVVQEFFFNGKMLRSINCIYITLIPKKTQCFRCEGFSTYSMLYHYLQNHFESAC